MRDIRPTDAAVTGTGCVTALGRTLAESHAAVAAGQAGVRALDDTAADSGMDRAAVIDAPFLRIEVPDEMEPQIKFLNGAGELAVEACTEAVQQAALLDAPYEDTMRGLYLSQMDSYDWSCPEFHNAGAALPEGDEPWDQQLVNKTASRKVKPFFMLESLKNNAFSFLATWYGLRGANTSVAGFSGPTWTCFDMAARSLARGSLDAAIVLGAARPTSGVARAEMDAQAVRAPAGDGAGALVLERHGEAAARGAGVHAVILGLGAATVAPEEGDWAPPTEALVAAAAQALEEAGMEPGELAAVVAPALGERGLAEALADLPAAAGAPLRAFKAQIGHCGLAAEPVEACLAIAAMDEEDAGPILVLTAGLLGQAGALVLARP